MRLGDPWVVSFGPLDPQEYGRFGATRVTVVDDPAVAEHPVLPVVDTVAALLAELPEPPAAILTPSSSDMREVAARLAVRTGSGVITDAVDVRPDGQGAVVATQSVFAASFIVTSDVTVGIPVITVKANAVTPEEALPPSRPTTGPPSSPTWPVRSASPAAPRASPPVGPS